MLNIEGKTIVTTDWHWGLKSDSASRLKILIRVSQSIIEYCKKNKVKNIIFCGDWMHCRNQCNVQSLDCAYKCLEKITKNVNFYFVLGNHDLFFKNTTDVTSAKLFKNIKNVHIVSETTECDVNGKHCLLCPWLSDISQYGESTFDMVFGHFDISHQFVMAQYIENHRSKNMTKEEIMKKIENDHLLEESGLDDLDDITENTVETFMNHKKSSDLIGSWINIVKEKGTIFAGHIHNRSEFYTNNRKFIFIGSPYQQTLGEIDSDDGFYVISDDGSYSFNPLKEIPHHIELNMTDIADNLDTFDFSVVTDNIIHKIYTKELDSEVEQTINRRIFENNPFEELNPEYNIKTSKGVDEIEFNENINTIRRSPLSFLMKYINEIPDEVLIKNNTPDRNILINMMKEAYEEATTK